MTIMTNIRTSIRKSCLLLAVAVLTLTTPLATLSSASAATADCVAPDPASYGAGVHQPTGSEAKAFIYQCEGPYAGLWLSERNVYYPQNNRVEPRDEVIYYYNRASDKFDYATWSWSAAQERYVKVDGSVTNPPAGAKTSGSRPVVATAPVTAAAASAATGGTSVNGTGPGSNTSTNSTTNNNGTVNNTNGATVTNTIGSTATSGNATVLNNTNGGNATTGDVITQADVTNMLQSSSNALGEGSNVATFNYTIDGDFFGDLLFDPNAIQNVQGNVDSNENLNNNLTINNTSNATINNNLTLNSQSGDATVANNTTGGSATTGSAKSIANIVNSIRSAVTAGKSFVGTINITGNLNGDILLPANFVDQLIASNVPTVSVTGPNSNTTSNTTTNDNTTITNNTTQGVNNNVNSTATTGSATVTNNTRGGTATSGNSSTNVTAFNLTGSRVVAKNSMLVYVNALGKWTGLIVNAPAGATAAMIGGNVTTNKTTNNNTNVTNNTNQQINNNVNVNATSGNATVNNNTNGGSAKAGDAQTAVNLVNIEDSSFELSDWFGILYINVFGSWNGSFGVDTAAGNAAVASTDTNQQFLVGNVSKLVRFPARAPAVTAPSTSTSAAPAPATVPEDEGVVLAAATKEAPKKVAATGPQGKETVNSKLWLPALGLIAALLILGSDRIFKRRNTA